MLVNLQTIIDMAEKGGYCIPAFNVYNTETVMGIIDAAEEERAPVIIQIYPRLLNEEVGFYIAPAVVAAAQRATVPICFHLDHGPSELEVIRSIAVARGYTIEELEVVRHQKADDRGGFNKKILLIETIER